MSHRRQAARLCRLFALMVLLATAMSPSATAAGNCDSGILQLMRLPEKDPRGICYSYPLNLNSIKAFCTSTLRVRVDKGVVKAVPIVQGIYKYLHHNHYNVADFFETSERVYRFNCKDANASGTYIPGSTTAATLMMYNELGGPLSTLNKTGADQVTLTPGRSFGYVGILASNYSCRYTYKVVQGCVLGAKAPAQPPTTCPAGFIRSPKGRFGLPYCTPCQSGTYSSKPGAPCKPCPVNTYSDSIGATKCTKCPLHSYAAAPGSSECTECDFMDKTYSDGKKCAKCPKGSQVASYDVTKCVRCNAGKRCCTAGWDKDCPKCTGAAGPAKTYTSIFALESGTPATCLTTDYALCNPKINITIDDAACAVSMDNLGYSNSPNDNADACSWGVVADIKSTNGGIQTLAELRDSMSAPNILAFGNFTSVSSSISVNPPYVTFKFPSAKCTLRYRALTSPAAALLGAAPMPAKATSCPAGRYLETKTDAKPGPCLLCPPGTYSPAPSSGRGCIRCPAGTYAKGYGNTKCKRCPAGRVSQKPGAAVCRFCESETRATSAKSCASCPDGYFIFSQRAGGQCLGIAYGSVCCATGNCKGQTTCKGLGTTDASNRENLYTTVLQLVSKSLPQPACKAARFLSCLPANGKVLLAASPLNIPTITLQAYRTPWTCKNYTGFDNTYEGGYLSTKSAYVRVSDQELGMEVGFAMISDSTKGTVTMYLTPTDDVSSYDYMSSYKFLPQTPPKSPGPCTATFKLVNGYAFDLKPPTGAKCDPADAVLTAKGRNFCLPCPKGEFSNSRRRCQKCTNGYYNDKEGAATCKPCRAGFSCADGAAAMTPCTNGRYSKAKQAACSRCPANTYTPASPPNPEDETEPFQIFPSPDVVWAPVVNTKCIKCPKGTIAPKNATACGVPWDKAFAP